FDRGTSVKTLMAHVNEAAPALIEVNPEALVSREMQSIITRCLAKDPAERYRDMDALLVDLTAVEGGGHLTESLRNVRAVRPRSLSARSLSVSGPRPKLRAEDESPTRLISDGSDRPDRPSGFDTQRSPSLPPSHTTAALAHQLELTPQPKRRVGLWVALVGMVAVGGAVAFALQGRVVAPAPKETTPVAAPPPPAPSPTTAPTPVTQQVLIASEPSGAAVFEAERELCKETPCNVAFEGEAAAGEHTLVLRKKGYHDAE